MARVLLVVAPHPDDETLGCGGTIAKKIREGHRVKVVFMTDGRNSHMSALGIARDPTPNELIRIRKKEAKKATAALGMRESDLIFLNFEDGSLNRNLEPAKERLVEILRALKPDEIYFPSKLDLHRDHSSSSVIVEGSVKSLSLFSVMYQYVIWAGETSSTPNDDRLVRVDISSVLAQKLKAISAYESQITNFSKAQTHPVLSGGFLERFRASTEVFIKPG